MAGSEPGRTSRRRFLVCFAFLINRVHVLGHSGERIGRSPQMTGIKVK